MARKNEYGKYILSAGEIGAFTVCPEAWRLGNVKKVQAKASRERIQRGNEMHKEWADNLNEAVVLKRSVRLMVLLILCAIIIFVLTQQMGIIR